MSQSIGQKITISKVIDFMEKYNGIYDVAFNNCQRFATELFKFISSFIVWFDYISIFLYDYMYLCISNFKFIKS